MKLFLLITHEQDDYDHVYGVFDSRELAEAAKKENKFYLIGCAEIVGLDLNKCTGRERSHAESSVPPEYLRVFEKSPWAELIK